MPLMITLLSVAGLAGAYIIPQTVPAAVAASAASVSAAAVSPSRSLPEDMTMSPPQDLPSETANASSNPATGRPADALTAWAVPLAVELGLPAVAIQAYGYAELAIARVTPTCRLSWTTLAGIGKIESDHGRGNGANLTVGGKALPAIVGPTLDGQNGTDLIADTDSGELDNDPIWDHAVGPMQFLPSTWQQYAVDADADGVLDPNDIDDAALAAGSYLCASGQDMSTSDGWYAAILTYNAVRAYAQDVYTAADEYGTRSHE